MNGMEVSPPHPRHTVSVPIGLDIDRQFELMHQLKTLSSELQEDPFIRPAKSVTELKGISLRPTHQEGLASHMSLKVHEADTGHYSAAIALTSSNPYGKEQHIYTHRPTFNTWEVWRPGAPDITHVSNTTLITEIEEHIPKGILETLMDKTSSTGKEVVHMLANHLRSRARTRISHQHYKAHNIPLSGSELTHDTDFTIHTMNNRILRSLFVAASFDVEDFGEIRKAYTFSTTTERGHLQSAGAAVSISADAHVPKSRLRAFGLRDMVRNDASESVLIAVEDIRSAY